ncbi:hypothetical protein CHS0354_028915 [Potamilus streckersoni]|uniref:Uncharacterized protein n=1 Tax=Potamilus streckersoni TaxID=2493646 RepID=A0AAE0SJ17_9BIVA|nr:hypothetical protein CHS0354_028915 [Potamilus streckersoni]
MQRSVSVTQLGRVTGRRMSIRPDHALLPPIVETTNMVNAPQGKSIKITSSSVDVRRRESLDSNISGHNTPRPSVSISRRLSIQNRRRSSFKVPGTKVHSMIRVKRALEKINRNGEEENEHGEEARKSKDIKEMPKYPRFASTLSAEAQYAMMKGYEDVVYNYLCESYPEYQPLLKRTKTPVSGVKIRPNVPTDEPKKSDLISEDQGENDHVDVDKKDSMTDDPKPFSAKNRSYSVYGSDIFALRKRSDVKGSDKRPGLSRALSLPHLAAKDRQLVMTYRYQSVMDILDTIRKQLGMHLLSPRVMGNHQEIKPLQDYNMWANAWNQEFKIVPNSDSVKSLTS